MSAQPSVIISQDLSGIGQVSMGVALPLLAAMDYAPYILPTALLSTHTGGLGANTYLDLADQMPAILAHWQTLNLKPSGLLLGYLGQHALTQWRQALPTFAAVPVRVIDPVMGDHGQLYQGFDHDYVAAMQDLVRQATVITPNATEAQLLLDQTPTDARLTPHAAYELVQALVARYQVAVVLTGVAIAPKGLAIVGQVVGQTPWLQEVQAQPGHYFGTGDIFASVLCGALMRRWSLRAASDLAQQFVGMGIARTRAQASDVRFGVNYMAALPWLLGQLDPR
ncbi:PfkB family carbohydrate kinase [Lacticaseibacillus jixiensis]|uniref:PfkB family carbohydrate kinase n=1 Tax=Lacticaseibacillus jixiensis TaxID=3231926 RepID=UPI0036F360DA